ncbi:hypothetical protein N8766_03430, partial [bacterium]|nr:hypothetical protein [bacterium]
AFQLWVIDIDEFVVSDLCQKKRFSRFPLEKVVVGTGFEPATEALFVFREAALACVIADVYA